MNLSNKPIAKPSWWFANNQPRLECTSTHCERAQECRSPNECTGDGKRWNLHGTQP